MPIDIEQDQANSGNTRHGFAAAQTALDALSSNTPGSSSMTGSPNPPPPSHYNDRATRAAVQAAHHPGALQISVQQQWDNAPAGPASSATHTADSLGATDSADSSGGGGGVSGGHLGGATGSTMSSGNSSLSALQVVTELSVNIDAEEGENMS